MKVREIAERLAPLFCGDAIVPPFSAEPVIKSLLGVPLEKIAEALGVPVEPDEPELPDVLHITVSSNHDSHGPSHTLAESLNEDSVSVTVCGPTAEFCRKLAGAVVSAYNKRPRWRPGVPPSPGRYVVKNQEGERFDAEWRPDSWTGTAVSKSGRWLRDGMPLHSTVVGWQPLPE